MSTSDTSEAAFLKPDPLNPLDGLAEILHDKWCEWKSGQGVPHNHLGPWMNKKVHEQNQDRYQAALILHGWLSGKITRENLPEVIHETWREWMKLTGIKKSYDRPFEEIHGPGKDAGEHPIQAPKVYEYLMTLPVGGANLSRFGF